MLEFFHIICFMNYMHSKSIINKIKGIWKVKTSINNELHCRGKKWTFNIIIQYKGFKTTYKK